MACCSAFVQLENPRSRADDTLSEWHFTNITVIISVPKENFLIVCFQDLEHKRAEPLPEVREREAPSLSLITASERRWSGVSSEPVGSAQMVAHTRSRHISHRDDSNKDRRAERRGEQQGPWLRRVTYTCTCQG
uniref:Uncharacterized protein n=1 Tax=Knipowitschia caucasica TaxID=637954 RepID=A0AAV2JJM0_KNICA